MFAVVVVVVALLVYAEQSNAGADTLSDVGIDIVTPVRNTEGRQTHIHSRGSVAWQELEWTQVEPLDLL